MAFMYVRMYSLPLDMSLTLNKINVLYCHTDDRYYLCTYGRISCMKLHYHAIDVNVTGIA